MDEFHFIQDMAIIMLIAGLTTILFHRLKQPVVLGYIIAGVIIGPYTPPAHLISDQNIIRIFAELGVIFLMFSLGLEFSLRKLREVGTSALVAALLEIVVMIWIGYSIGRVFNWSPVDALFLGAILAISSTTIIVKVLNDLGLQKERFAQLIFGILIVEDILGIAILALLSGIGTSNIISPLEIVITLGKLLLFLVVSLSIGILIIPRLIAYVATFNNREMLLITVLSLCFGFCLLVLKFNYSIVLGAFIIGAIVAESRELLVIKKLIAPLRDMFSAIFFVAIGMLLNPQMIIPYLGPILIITLGVIIGKVVTCSFGAFITGQDGRTSLRVGMGLAQIGEFSFIIASLGITLKITDNFLYPVAVAVSALTTITTPYLIKYADPLSITLSKIVPYRISYIFQSYTGWLQSLHYKGHANGHGKIIQRNLFLVFINLAFIASIFISFSYLVNSNLFIVLNFTNNYLLKSIACGSALVISLPFLIAIYRKIKAISMMLADINPGENVEGKLTISVRRVVSELIPIVSIVGIMLFIFALSASILPRIELLIVILIFVAILAAILWRWFIKLYSRLQASMMDVVEGKKNTP